MIGGDQPEGAEAPENEGVRDAGEWPLRDHLGLEHDLPQEFPDAPHHRVQVKIRRRARIMDYRQHGAEAPPEQTGGGGHQKEENEPFGPGADVHVRSLNVACGVADAPLE